MKEKEEGGIHHRPKGTHRNQKKEELPRGVKRKYKASTQNNGEKMPESKLREEKTNSESLIKKILKRQIV